jgi:hypothetical protein
VLLVIDLALQDLLGACYRNGRYLPTKLFTSTIRFLLNFSFGCTQLPLAFFRAIGLTVDNNLVRPGVRLVENAGCLLTCVANDALGLNGRILKRLLPFISSSEAFGDLCLALFDCREQGRPYVLHTEPDKHDHRDRLAD